MVTVVSNKVGQVLSAKFDILDRATNSVDANGVSMVSTYDNLHRLLTRTYPDNGQEKFVYTANVAWVTSYTNQLGSNVFNYAYDSRGLKTNEIAVGIYTNGFTYNGAGDLLTLKDGKSQTTSWKFDQFGRVT